MCLGKLRMINSQTKPIQLSDFKDKEAILKASRHNSHNTYKVCKFYWHQDIQEQPAKQDKNGALFSDNQKKGSKL